MAKKVNKGSAPKTQIKRVAPEKVDEAPKPTEVEAQIIKEATNKFGNKVTSTVAVASKKFDELIDYVDGLDFAPIRKTNIKRKLRGIQRRHLG